MSVVVTRPLYLLKESLEVVMKTVVVVESPNKVGKIQSVLGDGYHVIATYGHVCDLPDDDLGVDMATLKPVFVTSKSGEKFIKSMQSLMPACDQILFATDPDREGEAIAFHVARLLRYPFEKVQRIDLIELTHSGIIQAVSNPRPLDVNLVKAQEARRVLDRLIGYQVSPKLSEVFSRNLSAGRVQSAVLKMMVDREQEITDFVKDKYFRVKLGMGAWDAHWETSDHAGDSKKISRDMDTALSAASVNSLSVDAVSVEDKDIEPPPPFTTAKAIKVSASVLGIDPATTMRLLQDLFVGGFITYHRTDSTRMSDEAIDQVRAFLDKESLPMPPDRIVHRQKGKNAQEAHEAIRPADVFLLDVTTVNDSDLTKEHDDLYKLIHRQTLASQMIPAHRTITRVRFVGDNKFFYRARGVEYTERGFFLLLPEMAMEFPELFLPEMEIGDVFYPEKRVVTEAQTVPPNRYTVPGLIEAMEDLGVGRPSTYASIYETLVRRDYIETHKKALKPTTLGTLVAQALSNTHFAHVDYTSHVEEMLDAVSTGSANFRDLVERVAGEVEDDLNHVAVHESDVSRLTLKRCRVCGKPMRMRKGSHGSFWGCTAYPECKHTEKN